MLNGTPRNSVGRALVELAREPSLGDVELEEGVAGRERHRGEVGDVPRADEVAARVGIGADPLDHLAELVDVPAVGGRPRAPLLPVHRAELAALVGPLVPDRDPALLEPAHVRVAAQEPEELADDRADVHLLRRHEREAVGQVEPHLVAEDAERAGARAVGLRDPVVEHALQEVEVLLHAPNVAPVR